MTTVAPVKKSFRFQKKGARHKPFSGVVAIDNDTLDNFWHEAASELAMLVIEEVTEAAGEETDPMLKADPWSWSGQTPRRVVLFAYIRQS